jgi:hypothetical protein
MLFCVFPKALKVTHGYVEGACGLHVYAEAGLFFVCSTVTVCRWNECVFVEAGSSSNILLVVLLKFMVRAKG